MYRKQAYKIFQETECILPVVILLLVWYVLTSSDNYNEVLFPSLITVIATFVKKIQDLSLIEAVLISLSRVLKGYFLAAVLGIFFGVLIGLSKHFQRITDLFIQILKPIPPIAWIPLVILWMGIGEASKVFLIFLGGFFTILLNVIDGIRYTDKKLLEVASVMETPKKKYILHLVIPAAFPSIFTGLRVAMGTCWTCVVAAELVASSSGVGYMISNARNFGRMDIVIIGMISIGIVGKVMDVILMQIEKRVLSWNY
jgi:sulfonate transport system permease protein